MIFIIYNEYKSFLITNQNISFSTFLTSNIQKIVNLDINSDRIINKNINKNIYIYDKKFSDEGFLLVSGYCLLNFRVITVKLENQKMGGCQSIFNLNLTIL